MTKLETLYQSFVQEAELFFVKKFTTSNTIKTELMFCLDMLFNIEQNPDRDYTRGFIAYNEKYGQGKTFFFEVIAHRYRRKKNKNLFKIIKADALVEIYKTGGKKALFEAVSGNNICIDDIGLEEKVTNQFGNKVSVIREVLLYRYDMWIKKGWKTYGTTNLSIEAIQDCYDGRVADRLLQMCYIRSFNFLGKGSFRQMKSSRKLTAAEITDSWVKVTPPTKPEEKPDLTAYMNDLLTADEDYFSRLDVFHLRHIREYLTGCGIITDKDFSAIDGDAMNAAFTIEKQEARETVKLLYKHVIADVRQRYLDDAIKAITEDRVRERAELIIVKQKMRDLRAKPEFKFT